MVKANPKHKHVTKDEDASRLTRFRDLGYNVSALAREIGVERSSAQHAIRRWVRDGLLSEEEMNTASTPRLEQYLAAKERKTVAFQKKQRAGDWRKPILRNLPPRPFRLKVFGDPHLDDDGCDFDLFERHWMEMDAAEGVYGLCVGDWFNNWSRSLAHLWKETHTDPSDAWVLFERMMDERGDALLANCSGNHDDWTHGPVDPIDLIMKRYGVVHRIGGLRLALGFAGLEPLIISMRHKWRGSSIYSPAHGIVRAAIWGWRDLVMIGGHIHQDDPRMHSFPDGFRAHICQVSAFKTADRYVDTEGFLGPKISPVWDLVIDPSRPDTDPDKVKVFWDSTAAAGYLAYLRSAA